MAKRTAYIPQFTPTVTADTTALVNSTYMAALRGSTVTQVTRVWEVKLTGQVLASAAPMDIPLAYASTLSVGALSGLNDNPTDPYTAALASPVGIGNSAATSAPQRLSTGKLLDCGLNGYGGIFKWQAYDFSFCPMIVTNAVNIGEMNLSVRSGTVGLVTGHMIYETQ